MARNFRRGRGICCEPSVARALVPAAFRLIGTPGEVSDAPQLRCKLRSAGTSADAARTSARATALWAVSAFCALPSVAADYVSAQACRPCHAKQFGAQSSTGHAHALHRALTHPLAAAWNSPRAARRAPSFEFRISAARIRAWDDKDVIDLPVHWAFGAGTQAVTFVTRVNREFHLEHFFSYYTAIKDFLPTPGQHSVKAGSLREAVGLLYKSEDSRVGINGCFACHSTGPLQFGPDREITPMESGVRCEACHGPGGDHVGAPSRSNIGNPKRLPPPQLNQFCGRCHRPPTTDSAKFDWNYAWNVRHAPIYFNESACFRMSQSLSCLTCHAPHESIRKDSAHYNRQCRACHAAPKHRTVSAPRNCIDCHMPAVSPEPPLRFSNHWIGIYQSGAKLKPIASRRLAPPARGGP